MQQEITFVNYCVQEHSDPKHLESSLELQKNTTVMAQLLQYRCTITRKKKDRCTMDAARLQNRRKHIIKVNVMLQMRKKTRI